MASFHKQKTKKGEAWYVRFRIIENGVEKQKKLSSFKTKREAEKAYMDFIAKHSNEIKEKENKNVTFNDVVENYLIYASTRIKETSLYDVERRIYNHILPAFESKPIKEITPKDILLWQNSLSEYSFKYKTVLRGHLHTILKFAVTYYDLQSNPIDKVEPFRNIEAKKEMDFYTVQEFSQFSSVIKNIEHLVFFSFLFYMGTRKGEALALSWSDVDLKNNIVNINKSVSTKTENSAWVITTPKNSSSYRRLKMPQKLLKLMKEYKSWQIENKPSTAFVFGGERPLANRTIERYTGTYAKLAKIKKIRIHDFRHSCASLMISLGANIKLIADRLGHSSVEQTLNNYAHLYPSDEQKIIDLIDKI